MENKKIKIEIKNIWTGNILFEYEKENNTIKETLEKAVKEGANLEGASLEGANLEEANLEGANLEGANLHRANLGGANLEEANLGGANLEEANLEGANLEGASLEGAYLEGTYLYLYDSKELENKDEIISNFEEQTGIKIKSTYINKHVLSPYYLIYWKNGLIIDEYEYIGKEEIKEEDAKFDLDNATYNEKYLYEKIKELMED